MNCLGISALYHDSAAALVRDGSIIAAAQEERFTRVKHDKSMPAEAVKFCLAQGGITPAELDCAVFYDNPLLTCSRFLRNCVVEQEKAATLIENSAESLFGEKLNVDKLIRSLLPGFSGKVLVCSHHLSHAASAFYPSPFDKAAILTVDGVGEWRTTTLGVGEKEQIKLIKELRYPHSLGLLYSAMTYFCGFKVNSGEYKLMGLAPYGEPIFADLIREKLINIAPDGSFALNMEFFEYTRGEKMTGEAFENLFSTSRREPESRLRKVDMDLAASIQQVTEEIVGKLAVTACNLAGTDKLCMAGGVALNCVANGKLLAKKICKDIWIQPAAGDAGGALGCALYTSYTLGKAERPSPCGKDTQRGSFLGPAYPGKSIKSFLESKNIPYHSNCGPADVAKLLADDKAVGLFCGAMEFGPRALGHRSIIASPLNPETQSKLNLKIKFRESFRPFAPAVLAHKCKDYFDLDSESPYMLLTAPVTKERQLDFNLPALLEKSGGDMLTAVNIPRSDIPAVTHVDYSARVQTVDKERNPEFFAIIEEFEKLTGYAVVVNTSFNVRGEPIVCTPEDAWLCFMRTGLDALVLEDCLLLKEEQPEFEEKEDWKTRYELD